MPARIRLRAETTKAKRAETLVIHPQLLEELRNARPANSKPNDSVVSSVPSMKVMTADLKFAGIDPGTQAIGFVDFHALRKTLSTMMAAAGMSQRVRQAQMRHTDPRLTDNTYVDEALLPIAGELTKLAPILAIDEAVPEAIPLRATGTEDSTPQKSSAPIQQTRTSERQEQASSDTDPAMVEAARSVKDDSHNPLRQERFVTQQHDPAPSGTGSSSKAGEGGRTLDIHVGNSIF